MSGTIGFKEIMNGIKDGKIKKVIVAKNCPEDMRKQLGDVKIEVFNGDEIQLGTKLGKPFPIAMVGYNDLYTELK